MTWTKFSDDFADDCETLSDAAFRLHVEGLLWNNRKLLDLRIPKANLRRFASHPEAAQELVNSGYWEDAGGVYVIRHHAIYQRTREAIIKQQEVNAANGRKGGRPPKPGRERAFETYSETHSLSDSKSEMVRTGRALDNEVLSNEILKSEATPAALPHVADALRSWDLVPGPSGSASNPRACATRTCNGRLTDWALQHGQQVCNLCAESTAA